MDLKKIVMYDNTKPYVNKINFFPSLGIYHANSDFCKKNVCKKELHTSIGLALVHHIAEWENFTNSNKCQNAIMNMKADTTPMCVTNNLERMTRYCNDSPM